MAAAVLHGELVVRARADARNEQFPHAGRDVLPHRVAAAIPHVEVADDGDALGIRRPDGEVHAGHAVDRAQVGAELLVALPMLCLRRAGANRVRPASAGTRRGRAWCGSRQTCRSRGVGSWGLGTGGWGLRIRFVAVVCRALRRPLRTSRPGGSAASGGLRRGPGRRPRPAGLPASTPARPAPGGRSARSRADRAPRTDFHDSHKSLGRSSGGEVGFARYSPFNADSIRRGKSRSGGAVLLCAVRRPE